MNFEIDDDHQAIHDRFDGLSLFLVDLDPDHVEIAPIPKVGRNAVASCEVAYDELPVDGWRLVGERGRGFRQILHGLNPERVLLAAMSCGLGEACWLAADQAIQTHGGLGYAIEYHVERYRREARLQRLAPVSQEMTLNFIAQSVLGRPRSY